MYHREDAEETAAVDDHVKNMITKALEMEGTSTVRLRTTSPHSYRLPIALLSQARRCVTDT